MQRLICLAFIMSLLSCSKEPEVAVKESCIGYINLETMSFPQKWKLVKMTGSMMNSETTGSNMSWQEYILLNRNGSFIKHREQNSQEQEATGTYSFSDTSNNTIELNLIYPTTGNLVGSCYGQTSEKYLLITQCKMVGTWQHCDGPGLEYEKEQ